MDTRKVTRERVSAFADGELGDAELEQVFKDLRDTEGRADWELYHQIGDVLKSDDMDMQLSPRFSAELAAKLECEPAYIAPTSSRRIDDSNPRARIFRNLVGAAAIATFAFVATPQLMSGYMSPTESGLPVSSISERDQAAEVVATSVPDGVILRDARIDDYLHAHQRYSPSVYSSAQYTRSATFSNK